MTQPPENPLSVIFFSCKTNCGNSCRCKKHGSFSNAACKNCAGSNCTNTNINNFEEQNEQNKSPKLT